MNPNDPQRILLIRLSALGDVINTFPALDAIRSRFPQAQVDYAVEDRFAELLQAHPSINRVHVFERQKWRKMLKRPWLWAHLLVAIVRHWRALRSGAYDVSVDFQGNFKGVLHVKMAGAVRRVGFARGHCREGSWFFQTEPVSPKPEEVHRVDKFLSLARHLGAPEREPRYGLPETSSHRPRIDTFLKTAGIREYVVIHPGTSDAGKEKRWRPERFAALADRMGRERGMRTVVTWGPRERDLAARVVAQGGGWAVLSMETKTLLELAELIRGARLFIGCDSGPMHLASAVETPCVALFGPKDPRIYGPRQRRHRVIYRVPDGRGPVMDTIEVDEVYREVVGMLETGA